MEGERSLLTYAMRGVVVASMMVFMLVSCSIGNNRIAQDVSFKHGLLEKVNGKFVVVDETFVIKKSDVVSSSRSFGVLLSSNYDFDFMTELTFPKVDFYGENVSSIRIVDENISVKMKRRTKDGYGYVSLTLDPNDPYGDYLVRIYAGDSMVFRALFEVVEN